MKRIAQKQLTEKRLREYCAILRRQRQFSNAVAYRGESIEAICYQASSRRWGWVAIGPDGWAEHGFCRDAYDPQTIPRLYAERIAEMRETRATCFACEGRISEERIAQDFYGCCDECEEIWRKTRAAVTGMNAAMQKALK